MRYNDFSLIVGDRGTGKTTFQKNILKVNQKKSLVMDLIDHPTWRDFYTIKDTDLKKWKSGNVRVITDDPERTVKLIAQYVYNSNIIYEDANQYFDFNLSKDVKKVIIQSKQKNNDIFAMYHGLAEIPKYFRSMFNSLILFKTNDVLSETKKFAAKNKLEKAFLAVQKHKSNFYCEAITN